MRINIMTKTIQELIGCLPLDEIFRFNEKMMRENPLEYMKNGTEKEIYHVMKMIPYATTRKHGLIFEDIAAFLFENPEICEMHILEVCDLIAYFNLRGNFTAETFHAFSAKIVKMYRQTLINFIMELEKMFAKYAFPYEKIPNAKLYRVMDREYNSNIISAFSSWSFYPIEHFCMEMNCHVYVLDTTDLKKMKFLYMEVRNPEFVADREFEILLPRGITFREVEKKKVSAVDKNFHSRRLPRSGKINFTIHTIKLTGISAKPLRKIKFPESIKVYYGFHN